MESFLQLLPVVVAWFSFFVCSVSAASLSARLFEDDGHSSNSGGATRRIATAVGMALIIVAVVIGAVWAVFFVRKWMRRPNQTQDAFLPPPFRNRPTAGRAMILVSPGTYQRYREALALQQYQPTSANAVPHIAGSSTHFVVVPPLRSPSPVHSVASNDVTAEGVGTNSKL